MARRRETRAERQAQTRAALLDAAVRAFARRGYDAASVAEIAEEAGYSHGAVYSNFTGKEDLFLALYEDWLARNVAQLQAAFAGSGPLSERARAAGEEWMQRFSGDPKPFLLRLEFALRAARDPKLRRKLRTRAGAVPLAIRRLLDEQVEAEGLSLPLPSGELALAFDALTLGLALKALSDPAAVRPGLLGDLLALIVGALVQPRGSRSR